MPVSLFFLEELILLYKIKKPVRLIELFAGIGSQAKALEKIGIDFEHYKICEVDEKAVRTYNAIHNTNFLPSDITQLKGSDLNIVDTDKYEYILTYSFPCTDLSPAGKVRGMEEGSGTASSLLWEVKRVLSELTEKPQILLMENVIQVHSKKNNASFERFKAFLEDIGYCNFMADLNANDYGVPQSRKRCFMISILGGNKDSYEFPNPFPLPYRFTELLEKDVPEEYYVDDKKAFALIDKLIKANKLSIPAIIDDTFGYENVPRIYDSYAPSIRASRGGLKVLTEMYPVAQRGRYIRGNSGKTEQQLELNDSNTANCVTTVQKDSMCLKEDAIAYDDYNSAIRKDQTCVGSITTTIGNHALRNGQKVIIGYRLRNYTIKEIFRLFSFEDEDYEKAIKVNKKTVLYKQLGNSIVVDVLVKIFMQFF